VVDEIGFRVLKCRGQTPVLAGCARCQLKFLTPPGMTDDQQAAADYLWNKYITHHCAADTASGKEGVRGTPPTLKYAPRKQSPRAA
jgi:hypothetical protein